MHIRSYHYHECKLARTILTARRNPKFCLARKDSMREKRRKVIFCCCFYLNTVSDLPLLSDTTSEWMWETMWIYTENKSESVHQNRILFRNLHKIQSKKILNQVIWISLNFRKKNLNDSDKIWMNGRSALYVSKSYKLLNLHELYTTCIHNICAVLESTDRLCNSWITPYNIRKIGSA